MRSNASMVGGNFTGQGRQRGTSDRFRRCTLGSLQVGSLELVMRTPQKHGQQICKTVLVVLHIKEVPVLLLW